jgi:hypothetical protein
MSLVPYNNPRRVIPRRSSATKTHQIFAFQAPIKGLDISQPLPGGDPLTAIRLINMVPRVLGCQLRAGYKRWCGNMGGEIRTLAVYQPALASEEQFFAGSSNGNVYDVTGTLPGATVPPIAFTSLGSLFDGEYSATNFTTSAGVHYLVMVSEGAGMWIYDGSTWTQVVQGTGALQIEGVDPALFDYVMIWKSRLWFIEKDSTRAWYLPVGQVAGKATAFDFGSLLANGGSLAALTNWTVDGGEGMDDNFVVVSTQGDILIYRGTDPDEASTFSMVGRWFIGRVPVGRRFLTQFSSDIAILSERGVCFLSELLRGQGFFTNATIAQNVNAELAAQVAQRLDSRYWEIVFLPHEQLIVINAPATASGEIQWAYEVNNKAFCTLKGMPMLTVQSLGGRTYFGDTEGNVWLGFEGNADGTVDDVTGKDLEGSVVSAFVSLGEGVRVKRFLMVRPSFISRSQPAVQARLNPDWSFALPAGAPNYLAAGESLWDSALWNTAVWSGETQTYEVWVGAVGTGRYASLSINVRGEADTIFVGWQALAEPGGIL